MKRVVEPVRRSLLDVVRDNLRAAGRKTYITRVAYIGEYFGSFKDFEEKMENVINDLQADYTDILITGLLLGYPKFYIHVLEASEDIMYKHFRIIRDNKIKDSTFGKAILLPFYHNVHQRFFTEWSYIYAIPPTLLEQLESYELADVKNQMSNCVTKLYTLCDYIANTVRDQTVTMDDVLRQLGEKGAQYLPESTVVEYLLNLDIPVLSTIEDFVKLHSTVPHINFYNDSIWPPPRDFIVSDVFGNDNCQHFERHSVKKQETSNILKHQHN